VYILPLKGRLVKAGFFSACFVDKQAQKGTVKATLFAFCQKGAKKTDKGVPVLNRPKRRNLKKSFLAHVQRQSEDRINKLMDFSLEDCSYEDHP
jgi:hypothetical protein